MTFLGSHSRESEGEDPTASSPTTQTLDATGIDIPTITRPASTHGPEVYIGANNVEDIGMTVGEQGAFLTLTLKREQVVEIGEVGDLLAFLQLLENPQIFRGLEQLVRAQDHIGDVGLDEGHHDHSEIISQIIELHPIDSPNAEVVLCHEALATRALHGITELEAPVSWRLGDSYVPADESLNSIHSSEHVKDCFRSPEFHLCIFVLHILPFN